MDYGQKYIAPDGRVYQLVGVPEEMLPDFRENSGDLEYIFDKTQEEYNISINSSGYLIVEDYQFQIKSDGRINTDVYWQLVPDAGVSADRQKDLDLLRMHNKLIKIKISLLDTDGTEVQNITGSVTGYPSYDIDSDSDIRRACNITIAVSDKNQINDDFEKTWDNRMVRLYCGIYDRDQEDYKWYNLGTMLMTNEEYTIESTRQEIKLNIVDLMASMSQERGSQVGETYLFQAGDVIKDLIEAFVAENTPYNTTDVEAFDDVIPYDLLSNLGDYPIDILRLIYDLFPYYEFFYDVDGVFVSQKIPMKISDPVDFGPQVLDDLIINETRNIDFSTVYNTTEIWGRSLSGDYIAMSCTTTSTDNPNDTYEIIIDETYTELTNGEKYTLVPETNSVSGMKLNIQDMGTFPICTVNGAGTTYTPIAAGEMKASTPYVIRYVEILVDDGNGDETLVGKAVLEGELQIRCIVQEITAMPSASVQQAYKERHQCNNVQWIVNPDSPFACTLDSTTGAILGEKRQVLEGGEYEGIYTTQLAYERASYENWLVCRCQDTIEFECILIPWMDVNHKIQYTSPANGELGTWLVKSISYDFKSWTMTVKASRFYPYYPFYENE